MTNIERKRGQLGHVKQVIEDAIELGNPFVRPNDPFVVLGIDQFSGSMFPVGSFNTPEEAMECVRKKSEEEHLYSEGPSEISTTFRSYSKNGLPVRL